MTRDIRVTTQVDFECTYLSHITTAKSGLHLDAHRYTIQVTVVGDPAFAEAPGVLISFDTLTTAVKMAVPDGVYLTNSGCTADEEIAKVLMKWGLPVQSLSVQTICAETLARIIGNQIQMKLVNIAPHVMIEEIKLRESARNFVIWRPDLS